MNRGGALVLIAAATLGLSSGCASIPQGPGFQQVQDAVRERSGLTVHWDQQAPPKPSPEEVVQALLQKELTAESAVEVALLNNRRLQATFEELEITRTELVQAALPRNPIFGGELRFPGSPSRPLEISLTQSLLDLVQLGVRRRLAAAAFEPAKLRTADAVLDLVAEVRSAFYSLQAAEQVKAMRQTVVDAARAAAELAIRQREAGNISDLDLENEQALLEQAKLDLAQSESDAFAKQERFNVLLGLWGPQTTWRIAPSLPALPGAEPDLERVETHAVSQRLDLMAARQDIEAAARALPLARTEGISD
ncbi:MAG TPA: TolC family protein, partial [archaeon]|nr:TolC family protein [archaeon]